VLKQSVMRLVRVLLGRSERVKGSGGGRKQERSRATVWFRFHRRCSSGSTRDCGTGASKLPSVPSHQPQLLPLPSASFSSTSPPSSSRLYFSPSTSTMDTTLSWSGAALA